MLKAWNAMKARWPKRYHANRTVGSVIEEWKSADVFNKDIRVDGRIKPLEDDTAAVVQYDDRPISEVTDEDNLRKMGRTFAQGMQDLPGKPVIRHLFTADGRLRSLSKRLGQMLYQRTNETVPEKAYHTGVRETRDQWIGEVQKVTTPMRNDEELQQRVGYELATGQVEGVHRSTKRIREVFQKYYSDYLSKHVGNLGPAVENYFPRNYDTMAIQSNPDEFLAILREDTGIENPNAILDSLTEQPTGFSNTETMTVSEKWMMDRKINNPQTIRKLVDAGFLSMEVEGSIIGYIERTTRRAEWERLFGAEVDGQWDPNGKLEKIIAEEANGDQAVAEELHYLVHRSVFNTPVDTNSFTYNAVGEIRAYESLRTLMFSGVASVPEVAAIFARMKGEIGIKDFVKAIGKNISNYKEGYELANAMGIVRNQTSAAMMTEMFMHEGDTKRGVARRMLPWIFKLNGNNAIVNYSRVMAAGMGIQFIKQSAAKAAKGDATAKRYLEELGINDHEIVTRWEKAGGEQNLWSIDSPEQEGSDQQIVQGAINRFVNESVLHPNNSERPTWADHPIGSLVFHLKTFAYSYSKNILGGIYRETQSRIGEGKGIPEGLASAAEFIAPAIFVFLVFGAISEEIRQRIMSLGERGGLAKANNNPVEYVGNMADRAGFTSLPFTEVFTGYGDAAERASYAAGPTAAHLYDIFFGDDSARSNAVNAIPVVSQMPSVRREMYDILK
jgi:hypothetical protein